MNELLRRHGEGVSVTRDADRVVRALTRCRTPALGGHVHACKTCGAKHHSYHSCRDRHCPTCQQGAREKWVRDRMDELLPVPYFHVVFTLPEELRDLALRNKTVVYGILMRASWETLRDLGLSKLKAAIGAIGMLHTWSQTLGHHPHVHYVIPSGGFARDGVHVSGARRILRWRHGRADYLLPVPALRKVFRGKFLAAIESAYKKGLLEFSGKCEERYSGGSASAFAELLRAVAAKSWVVHAKRPFAGPENVLRYLGNYTHRVAISNSRIIRADAETVTFRWKDYADSSKQKSMTLATREFLRRFLLHALPRGFVKIRFFGFLAHPVKAKRLDAARRMMGSRSRRALARAMSRAREAADKAEADSRSRYAPRCVHCGSREIIVIGVIASISTRRSREFDDTS